MDTLRRVPCRERIGGVGAFTAGIGLLEMRGVVMSTIVRAWTVGGAIEEILERVSLMYGTMERYPRETQASWEARLAGRRALVIFAEELSGAFAPDKDTLIGEVDLPR